MAKDKKIKLTPYGEHLDAKRRARRLSEGEINALEYYTHHQFGLESGLAQEYILRAMAELRAIRAGGVLVDVAKFIDAPPPEPQHLPGCKPPGQVLAHAEDAAPSDQGLGILEQNSHTTISAEYECDYSCPVFRAAQEAEWKAKDGKWTVSSSDEYWSAVYDTFDTEAEAIEWGKSWAADQGIEDGSTFWTGQLKHVTADELADVFDGEDMADRMESYLYDNFNDEVDHKIQPTKEEEADLERRVRPVIARWLTDTCNVPSVCHILHATSHVFHQCDAVDSTKNDPSNHPRCIEHDGHQGDHTWP